MIDENKLIETIKEIKADQGCLGMDFDVFIDIVKEQPNVGKWIPCSERLPEDKQEVKITDSQGRVRQIIFNKWLFENPKYYHGIKMLAWQPLPEPYKPDQQEEPWKDAVMQHFTRVE